MSHHHQILDQMKRAETELTEAIRTIYAFRGRGVDQDDAYRLIEVRNAVSEQHEWFRKSFENRL